MATMMIVMISADDINPLNLGSMIWGLMAKFTADLLPHKGAKLL
jgi:hypothetical protein